VSWRAFGGDRVAWQTPLEVVRSVA
jgi:hypothetical protein